MASDLKPESQLQLTQTEKYRDADLTQSMLQLNKRVCKQAPTHPDGSSFAMLANSVQLYQSVTCEQILSPKRPTPLLTATRGNLKTGT